MKNALFFTRTLFFFLSVLLFSITVSAVNGELTLANILIGSFCGTFVSILFFSLEGLLRKAHLRHLNTTILGLFIGLALFSVLFLTFQSVMESILPLTNLTSLDLLTLYALGKVSLLLIGLYLGIIVTFRCSETLRESLPFIKLKKETTSNKKLIATPALISDTRIVELARSGLLDQRLLIPKFVINELYTQSESIDEPIKIKARRSLENLRKLEEITHLELSYSEVDFPEVKHNSGKLIKLAIALKGDIFTSDTTSLEEKTNQRSLNIININDLSQYLKPLMEAGEVMEIKVQRFGKEAKQGIGYLDDGTMVVINGGGDYIGQLISTHVLSIKHTSTGRIIFCNAIEGENTKTTPEEQLEYSHA